MQGQTQEQAVDLYRDFHKPAPASEIPVKRETLEEWLSRLSACYKWMHDYSSKGKGLSKEEGMAIMRQDPNELLAEIYMAMAPVHQELVKTLAE